MSRIAIPFSDLGKIRLNALHPCMEISTHINLYSHIISRISIHYLNIHIHGYLCLRTKNTQQGNK